MAKDANCRPPRDDVHEDHFKQNRWSLQSAAELCTAHVCVCVGVCYMVFQTFAKKTSLASCTRRQRFAWSMRSNRVSVFILAGNVKNVGTPRMYVPASRPESPGKGARCWGICSILADTGQGKDLHLHVVYHHISSFDCSFTVNWLHIWAQIHSRTYCSMVKTKYVFDFKITHTYMVM